MPSTYTTNLLLEKQATGENDATWGDNLNDLFDLLDKIIAEQLALSVAGSSDVTLTDSQAANLYHLYSGTLTGNINVVVPARKRLQVFENATSGAFTLTVKTAAGTGVAVTQGEKAILYCDGTNVEKVFATDDDALVNDTTPQLGGPLDTNDQAINYSEGAAVASATQPNIWATDGNTVHITGTTQIDDFADAPRVGASRWLVFDDALTLTHGSGITIIGAANVTTAAGGIAYVYADAVDAFRLIYWPPGGFPALDKEQEWTKPQRAAKTSVSPAATLNIDMSLTNDFEIDGQDQAFTLNFTNIQEGQGGNIVLIFDGGGPFALTAGTGVKTIDGTGINFTGSGATKNVLTYKAISATEVLVVLASDIKA